MSFSKGGGGASLPFTGIPLAMLLLIALTMIVVGVVMTRVAFGAAPATPGETPVATGTDPGASRP